MRRKEGIQLFSTSSIDLLACGLGGVLVLWLLVFGNQGGAETGDRPLGSGEMRIRQFGVAQLKSFEIEGYQLIEAVREGIDSPPTPIDLAEFNGNEVFDHPSFCTSQGRRWRFIAVYLEIDGDSRIEVSCRASEDYSTEITVSFSDMRQAAEVEMQLVAVNYASLSHLEVDSFDRRNMNTTRHVFQCEFVADYLLREDPEFDFDINFRTQIRNEVDNMCPGDVFEPPIDYRVFDCSPTLPMHAVVRFTNDGAVRFIAPSEQPAFPELDTIYGTPIRDRLVAWSGGTFGAYRAEACTP